MDSTEQRLEPNEGPPNAAAATTSPEDAAHILARLERLDVWSLSAMFIGIIGTGSLFILYDIFDINVAFVQACTQIVERCTPQTAVDHLGPPVLYHLVGYGIGTLILSPLSDRTGRRHMLMITMLITGVGSVYSAMAMDMTNLNLSRFITGIGVGADIAVMNVYINEVAPRRGRAKYTSLIFTMSAVGALVGIWLGLLLTTPAAPWPHGLPFALASSAFTSGWRWMFAIGGALAVIAVVCRFELPESPRWLLLRGRIAEADRVVTAMESRAARKGPLAEPQPLTVSSAADTTGSYLALLRDSRYRLRIPGLLLTMLLGCVVLYTYAGGFTAVLSAQNYSPAEAGMIGAIGTLGFVATGVFTYLYVERLERQQWVWIAAALNLVGGVIIALSGGNLLLASLGAIVLFFGFNIWVSPMYALTAESFPTRNRTTGYALVDGIGHAGAGAALFLVVPVLPHVSLLGVFAIISGFLLLAAVAVQFTVRTRNRSLEDISP
ncbi:MFS transporter [Nonomuraea lactucae]|uniref:MFS transporter n=1 Tax=Nonomuraea lactucae TaxID=2249762 RepID=UPI000DE405A0|nr:MFS transporter [Nonomuraea lactucae]